MGWLRRTRTTALVVVLLLCLTCVPLFVFDVIQLARAKALVAAVESLRIGVPWKEQSSAGVFQEQTCDKGICREEKIISNLPLVDSWRHRPADMPSFLHGRWWAVAATVTLDPAGKVVQKWLVIDNGKYFQFPIVEIFVASEPLLFDPCHYPNQIRHPGYRSRQENRTGALEINLSPDADEHWVHNAFDLRLNCLDSLKGCKDPSDIAPTAWEDMLHDRKIWESDVANQEQILKSCPQ
jgi:hypothetical protein